MKSRKNRVKKGYLALILVFTVCLGSASSRSNNLHDLVAQRLSYMKEVAAYKWQNELPIENSEREVLVVNSAVNQGLRYGITTTASRSFFKVQIEAAKQIQQYWFDRWLKYPERVPTSTVALETIIRPALIGLGEDISKALAQNSETLLELRVEGLSKEMVLALDESARSVSRYPDQLRQILDSGLLRVGTTGDYAPFSLGEQTGILQGVDIDLAEDLAQSLGVAVAWITTSWPTLMDDLHAGHYDIGMSGISINDQRRQTAFFSDAYHRGGKSVISRCADAHIFNTLEDIDVETTVVVVNPGGTNQKFVHSNIHTAKVIVHSDNRTVFKELVEHRADVMFTDLIEVKLQAGINPSLCPALGEQTLTITEKAFLLPRDEAWKAYVDNWMNAPDTRKIISERFSVHVP